MRKISILGLSVAVLAATGWVSQASAQAAAPDTTAPAATDTSTPAPAPAPMKKASHHHGKSMASHHGAATKGDAAVEDLNAQSLSAAKAGTAFKPATTPAPEKAPAKKAMKSTHHHHKAAKPAADAAPAPDASK